MTSSNRFLKLICLFAAVSLLLFVPETGVWAGTTGKISGIVTDAESGDPLPGVNVLIEGTTLGAATDLDGFYFIINIPPGEYSVRATMIGYTPIVQQQVRVIVDRTTPLNFTISPAVLESDEAVVVIAERPLVEKDVASSQSITTTETADVIPVSDIMQAVSLEPGVSVSENRMEVQIRGGSSEQIRFQVDGMERKDKLNDKVYTPTNSATVAEIQVLTGGFNAEYGNLRSGMFNVISKEGGPRITGSVDYRMAPGQYKHFGPDAYGTDQYDYKTFGTSAAFDTVRDVEGNQLFVGWTALAEQKNSENYLGKNNWTAASLQEVWKYRHRGYDYADTPDHYIDAGLGGPIPGLDALGIKQAGFFAGIKYNQISPILPAVRDMDEITSIEGKIHFKPGNNFKVVLTGLYGTTKTSTNGLNWGNTAEMEYGYNTVSAALNEYKYYLSAYNLLDMVTTQFGAKLTHSLSPSTFYEVRYNYFSTDTESGKGPDRNPATATTINGVAFDEVPVGWVSEANAIQDLTGFYEFYGGGRITDTSFVKTHLINLDLTSQVSNQHLIKLGVEMGFDHVVRSNRRVGSIILTPSPDQGHFVSFDRKPYHLAGYIQDKIEYGGLIANIGLRVEHYDAKGYIYDPGNLYSLFWARGGTAGYTDRDELPKEESTAYTYWAPRISVSHPVREHTKFFFNYGVYFNEPSNAQRYAMFSESWSFGNPQGDIRRVGYANLEAPRTAAYEVGFEQSIGTDWLIRSYFYSKDNSEQIGSIRVDGLDGTHSIGDFRNYEGVGKGAAGYNSSRNNGWQDIRGIELKVTKRTGQFFTGWLNMNYLVNTYGNYGIQNYNQDPLVAYYAYSAVKQQPQTQPSFIANFNFHTPNDFGMLWGDWRLSIVQSWAKGTKLIYNPTGLPTREVRTIYYWVNNYRTNLRLSKTLNLLANMNVRIYMDINNLFNFRALNLGNLGDAQDRYLTEVVDDQTGLGRKIGEYEDNQGNNVFTENWVDRNGTTRAPLAPNRDFALWYFPRSFLLGIKVEF